MACARVYPRRDWVSHGFGMVVVMVVMMVVAVLVVMVVVLYSSLH